MSTYHNCIYCNRIFHFKDIFDKHEEPCKYFHKSRNEKRYEQELIEKSKRLKRKLDIEKIKNSKKQKQLILIKIL